jgi:hypothetical protein
MTRLTISLLCSGSVLALVSMTHLVPAQACSGGLRGMILSRQAVPADGSTAVPTNARVYVSYSAYSPGVNDTLRLQATDGTDVAAIVSQPLNTPSGNTYNQTLMLVPSAPLQPNTKYRLLSTISQVPCLQDPSSGVLSQRHVAASHGHHGPAHLSFSVADTPGILDRHRREAPRGVFGPCLCGAGNHGRVLGAVSEQHGRRSGRLLRSGRRALARAPGRLVRISSRTVEDWYRAYRKGGFSG